eukprot:Selendium_serpulae@DN4167_c0_g1_i2.p2
MTKGLTVKEMLLGYAAFGVPLCCLAILLTPQISVVPLNMTPVMWSHFAASVVVLAMIYLICPVVINTAGATFFNLSLLSSDAFAVILSFVIFKDRFSSVYLLGIALVISGVVQFQAAEGTTH